MPRLQLRQGILPTAAYSVVALAALSGGAPARAQEAAGAERSGPTLGEIVVTARKREERLIDVPVAANVFGAQALERYAAVDLNALGQQAPQVSLDRAPVGSGGALTIRGVGPSIADVGIEQVVSVNADGVSISRGRVIQTATFDTQDVEILKGPQALYFGKNSPGGVIVLNSTSPGNRREGYFRAGLDTESLEYFGEGAISLTLTDSLSARIAVRGGFMAGRYMRNVAGPITDPAKLPLALFLGNSLGAPGAPVALPGAAYKDLPGARDVATRLTLKYNPNPRLSALFKFLYSEHRDRGDDSFVTTTGCGAFPTQVRTDLASSRLLPDPYGSCGIGRTASLGAIPAVVAANFPGSNGGKPFSRTPSYLSSLTMKYDVAPHVTLTSVTGFYSYTATGYANFDGTSYSFASASNKDTFHSVSQELRLATSFDGPANVTSGLFYENSQRTYDENGMIGYFGPDPLTGRTNSFSSHDHYTGKTYSAFSELNIRLLPNLELASGARYTSETKSADMGMTYLHSLLTGFALAPGQRIVGSFTEHNVSPQATLTWRFNNDAMVYAAYKQGFQSGGYSSPAIIPPTATKDNQRFGQERAEGGEVGLKFGNVHGLSGDLTAYDFLYKGLQLTSLDAATVSYFVQNAGSAKVQGVELNLNYTASGALSLRGSVGYNRARYEQFDKAQCWAFQTLNEGCDGGKQNLSGRPLSRAPAWTGSLGASYDAPLSDGWKLGLSVDGRYSSGYFTSVEDSPFARQGDYALLDVGARVYSDRWEFALIGRNLTDTLYITVGGDQALAPRGQTFGALNTPRQIILQATRRF